MVGKLSENDSHYKLGRGWGNNPSGYHPAVRVPVAVLLVIAMGLGGCGRGGTSTATSTSTRVTTAPASTTTTTAAWVVGATALPLRPDGLGEMLPTPAPLVDRRLPTKDLLPPPSSGAFASTISPISDAIRTRMGETYHDGCPVTLSELRYLTVSFWGFDDRAHTGELVVNQSQANNVVQVFATLFAHRFPIEEMRLPTTADLDAPPTGDGNNTAGFVCRNSRGTSSFSAHASGLAIDVNPFQNPYSKGDIVLPELASAYLDRSNHRPGMVYAGDVVQRAFASIGWSWGGAWRSPVDRMHFTATGH